MAYTTQKKIAQKITNISLGVKNRLHYKKWPSNSIAIYATETPYEWSPLSLKTGVGGAEGRIIYLAKEWAKKGYTVEVFNSCGENSGVFDGVTYRSHQEFNKHDHFDTLLVWHFAWRLNFPVKANRVWLDLGKGVLLPEESSYKKLGKYDKIFCKNKFHRSTLPNIPDEKIVIIPNGLDTGFQDLSRNQKDPNKCKKNQARRKVTGAGMQHTQNKWATSAADLCCRKEQTAGSCSARFTNLWGFDQRQHRNSHH